MCFLNVYQTESSHWCSLIYRSQSWIETRDSCLGSGWSNRRGEEASSLELMHLNFSFSANWTEGYKESKVERKEEAGSEWGFTPGHQGEFSNFLPCGLAEFTHHEVDREPFWGCFTWVSCSFCFCFWWSSVTKSDPLSSVSCLTCMHVLVSGNIYWIVAMG